jgi:hypothetical protein
MKKDLSIKLTEEHQIEKKKEWQIRLVTKGEKIKADNNKNLCPRCIFKEQDFTLSSEGYFTPCCWLDDELYKNQPWVDTLFRPHLNINNHNNIQDIFDSDEWKDFFNMLINDPNSAPPVCYEYCASEVGDKEELESNDDFVVFRKH